MQIYITDLSTICNQDDLVSKLSPSDLIKYKSFQRKIRTKQFLVAHTIANDIKKEFKYLSITHKDNFVIVAASNQPVGIDIEDASKERDFNLMAKFMNFQGAKNKDDFYREFTLYEAKYKLAINETECVPRFFKLNRYMICILSNDSKMIWMNPTLIPEQI